MSDKTNERGEPDEIWLQAYGDVDPADYPDKPANVKGDEITWCWEPIFEHDVKYVRADIVAALEAKNARLLQALKYARRFLRKDDHDVDYVDAVIAKATGGEA